MSGGAGSLPHPPAWLDVAPGVFSGGLKLREAEPFPSSRAWGMAAGRCRCGTAAWQPWAGGFPHPLRQGGPRCVWQGALPVSQLPRQPRFTPLAPLSSRFSSLYSVNAFTFAHAEHHR